VSRLSSRVVVGKRAVLEAVRAGSAREVLLVRGSRSTPGLRDVLLAAEKAGVAVTEVTRGRVEGLARGTRHQGVAARLRAHDREVSEAELGDMEWREDAVVLLLDGVMDPRNLGACARTAEAAGVAAIVVRRRRGAPVSPAAMSASAGALAHLPIARVANLARALELLKERGFWVVGLDSGAPGTVLDSSPPPGRLALVLGSEGAGLSRLVAERCDELLSIPMRGKVGSLNVSVAAGVALYGYALRGASAR